MNYTYQRSTESGSFAAPDGTDVEYARNKKELHLALERWQDDHDRLGADCQQAELVVWKGTLDDVTDQYPDFVIKGGPRGGMIIKEC